MSTRLENMRLAITCVVLMGLAALLVATPSMAQKLNNQVAVFSALDKVTARIRKLEIPINETVTFGSLKVTPRVCYTRPPEVKPKTTTFVEVDEIQLNGKEERIFSGWMFAESPGLNAVEHPVFDVWLTGCNKPDEESLRRSAAQQRNNNARTYGPPRQRTRRPRRRIRR
ncbi:MAG: DUF2155 domain-containing protein [Pseudomonadota bacterium]